MKRQTFLTLGLILIIIFAIGLFIKLDSPSLAPGPPNEHSEFFRIRNIFVQPTPPGPIGPCLPSQENNVACNSNPPDTGKKCTCDLDNNDQESCTWESLSCSRGYTCSESAGGCVPKVKSTKGGSFSVN